MSLQAFRELILGASGLRSRRLPLVPPLCLLFQWTCLCGCLEELLLLVRLATRTLFLHAAILMATLTSHFISPLLTARMAEH